MKKDDLARLHWIRKQREEKALKDVTARQGGLLRADRAAAEASAAVADHASNALKREREALGALVGKALRRPDILNLQSSLDAASDEHRTLEAAEQEAASQRDARRGELDSARTEFRRLHREAEKLAEIVEQRTMKAARRRLVFSEAADDESHGRGSRQLLHPPAGLRSEDA